MRSVYLVESPEKILGRLVDIIGARVIREVVGQRRVDQFFLENINLVQK